MTWNPLLICSWRSQMSDFTNKYKIKKWSPEFWHLFVELLLQNMEVFTYLVFGDTVRGLVATSLPQRGAHLQPHLIQSQLVIEIHGEGTDEIRRVIGARLCAVRRRGPLLPGDTRGCGRHLRLHLLNTSLCLQRIVPNEPPVRPLLLPGDTRGCGHHLRLHLLNTSLCLQRVVLIEPPVQRPGLGFECKVPVIIQQHHPKSKTEETKHCEDSKHFLKRLCFTSSKARRTLEPCDLHVSLQVKHNVPRDRTGVFYTHLPPGSSGQFRTHTCSSQV